MRISILGIGLVAMAVAGCGAKPKKAPNEAAQSQGAGAPAGETSPLKERWSFRVMKANPEDPSRPGPERINIARDTRRTDFAKDGESVWQASGVIQVPALEGAESVFLAWDGYESIQDVYFELEGQDQIDGSATFFRQRQLARRDSATQVWFIPFSELLGPTPNEWKLKDKISVRLEIHGKDGSLFEPTVSFSVWVPLPEIKVSRAEVIGDEVRVSFETASKREIRGKLAGGSGVVLVHGAIRETYFEQVGQGLTGNLIEERARMWGGQWKKDFSGDSGKITQESGNRFTVIYPLSGGECSLPALARQEFRYQYVGPNRCVRGECEEVILWGTLERTHSWAVAGRSPEVQLAVELDVYDDDAGALTAERRIFQFHAGGSNPGWASYSPWTSCRASF